MNLDEAIARIKKASEKRCMGERGKENFSQIAAWLEELKQYKEENHPEKTVVEKEKPQREAIKLFSVEIVLTPGAEDSVHTKTNIYGHRSAVQAFLETMDVDPEEYQSILKSAAHAMLKDFIQQVVNSSKSLEGAVIDELEN